MASKDWGGLRDEVEGILRGQFNQLIDGNIDDLNGPIREAANRLMVAIRRGPTGQPLVDETTDMLALMVVEKKVEVRQEFSGGFTTLLGMGLNTIFGAALAGLNAVKA